MLTLLLSAGAFAQTWDTSGNGLLNGNYYIREVIWQPSDAQGDLTDAASVYGEISFDGKGNYTFNGQSFDAQT
ncbi:MAG TPA: hypothetical protein VKS01_05030, partial [Bryobacteraceae bacterium]|nr:hypothetical protein [Bryobacteraceae bacterium]